MGSDWRVSLKPELPCAGCRLLHRKCSCDCILAPHFPTHQPHNFLIVHKVFGASNVVKMLQIVDEARREDAVKSLVYEANARLREPVYGCTSAISYLQSCIQQLQLQLKATQDQAIQLHEQNNHLLQLLEEMSCAYPPSSQRNSFISSTLHDAGGINSSQIYDM